MNVWKLIEAKKIEKSEVPLPGSTEGLIRVRIAKVLLNNQDAAIYLGKVRVRYPLIPGRYAVGFVAEEGHAAYPKGTRVLLHGYRAVPKEGTEKRDFTMDDYKACGRTIDGFLTDFVLVSPDDMTELPASVGDEKALLLHHIAAAKEIADKLDVQKGMHIAVVGADLLGILLCQLLIYQQESPILIDADKDRLDFARSCGIYYTMLANGELVDNVASVTGGRLASGAVYVAAAAGNDTDVPFSLCSRGAQVVFFATSMDKVTVNLQEAFSKHLTLNCVSHDIKYLQTAINLIANKAIDVSLFHFNTIRPEQIGELFSDYERNPLRDASEIDAVNLL